MTGPDGDADEVGDAACWLHELCPVCGAFPTADEPDRCWRCGHPLGADGPQDDPGSPASG